MFTVGAVVPGYPRCKRLWFLYEVGIRAFLFAFQHGCGFMLSTYGRKFNFWTTVQKIEIKNMEYPLKTRDYVKHPRMTLEDRAKIFAPFAALKGHDEAIGAKEKRVVPRIEISEESKEYLDMFDAASRILQIVDKRLKLEDIYNITS